MMNTEQDRLENIILRNRVLLTKVIVRPYDIVQYLYQEGHLNEDDVSEIKCEQINCSRGRKIGALLDIVKIKGPTAIECFLERLGWEYPQTYKQITGQDAKQRPELRLETSNFQHQRDSQVMDEHYSAKNNLEQNDKQRFIKLLKEDIEELERANQRLVEEKKKLNLALNELFIKSDKVQEHLTKSLQDYVICSKERDELRQNKFPERGQTTRPYIPPKPQAWVAPNAIGRPQPQQNRLRVDARLEIMSQQVEEERQKCDELSQLLNQEKEECSNVTSELREKKKELQTLQFSNREMVRAQKNHIDSKDEYMKIIIERDASLAKLNAEKSILFKEKHELMKEKDMFQQKFEQLELQSRSKMLGMTSGSSDGLRYPDVKSTDIQEYQNSNSNNISNFKSTSKLPNPAGSWLDKSKTMSLIVEYKPSIKKPNIYQDYDSHDANNPIYVGVMLTEVALPQHKEDIKEETGSENSDDIQSDSLSDSDRPLNTPGTDVCTAMNFQVDVGMFPIGLNRKIHDTIDDESITVPNVSTATMKTLLLIGGNYTGIFIKNIGSKITSRSKYQTLPHLTTASNAKDPHKQDIELREGDHIQKIICTDGETVEDTQVKGATLKKTKKLISFLTDDAEIQVIVSRNQKEYDIATEWMMNNNFGQGDFFFVRTNTGFKVGEDQILEGDILCVRNTLPDNKHWQAVRVDRILGRIEHKLLMIPNSRYPSPSLNRGVLDMSDKLRMGSGQKKVGLRHKPAMKIKDEYYLRYTNVIPVTAKANLPVILLGDPNLVDAVLSLLKDESENFVVLDNPEGSQLCHNTMQTAIQNNRHTIRKATLPLRAEELSVCIVILLDVSPTDTDSDLRNVFGKEVDISEKDNCLYKVLLQKSGIIYDIIKLLFSEVRDRNSLIERLVTFVNVAQHRKYWLSSEQLDQDTREKYSAFLDKPKFNLRSQSIEDDSMA